jgi:predicted acylesterase/phospholipase RssA
MPYFNEGARKHLKAHIQHIECILVRKMTDNPSWLSPNDCASLRWALSLARLSKIMVNKKKSKHDVELGQSQDSFRAELFALLGEKNYEENLTPLIRHIEKITQRQRRDLLSFFSKNLTASSLDEATRRRPLVLALSGGGGTAFVFVGAFLALEESGIIPSAITGSSMGAILGAYRARTKHFSCNNIDALVQKTSWTKIAQPYQGSSRFGIPGTFRLYLRDVVGHEFEHEQQFMRLKDMRIPLRVCVAGLSSTMLKEEDLSAYAKVDHEKSLISVIMDFAQKPLKKIYLGADALTKEFDVLDAIGFSAAIPGVFHYDIMRDDPRMIALITNLFEREGISRLIDGGFVDNLPMQEAIDIVDDGECDGYDPFALALDSFSPSFNRHLIFYPLMRFALEKSREGYEAAHLAVTFKNVLSPINLVPTIETFHDALKQGHEEFSPHIPFIRKMVGPIPDPAWLKKTSNL